MRLYYLYMDGCGACAKGKPFLAKFEKRHPEIQVMRVDMLTVGNRWRHSWKPEGTPTYVLEIPGHQRTRHEGWLTDAQIEQFLDKSKQMLGVR